MWRIPWEIFWELNRWPRETNKLAVCCLENSNLETGRRRDVPVDLKFDIGWRKAPVTRPAQMALEVEAASLTPRRGSRRASLGFGKKMTASFVEHRFTKKRGYLRWSLYSYIATCTAGSQLWQVQIEICEFPGNLVDLCTHVPHLAPMGSGFLPNNIKAASFSNIQLIDQNGQASKVRRDHPVFIDDGNIYSVSPINAEGKFTYGGPLG